MAYPYKFGLIRSCEEFVYVTKMLTNYLGLTSNIIAIFCDLYPKANKTLITGLVCLGLFGGRYNLAIKTFCYLRIFDAIEVILV